MIVLNVDPAGGRSRSASKTGYAVFETVGRQLLEYGVFTADQVDVKNVRYKLIMGCNLLFVEEQYGGINIQSMKLTIEAKCKWTVPARDNDIRVIEMQPSEWQSKVCPGWRRGIKREALEKGVRAYVESRFRLAPGSVPVDAIAAIGIGCAAVDMITVGMIDI